MTTKFETCPYNRILVHNITDVVVYDSTLREGSQVPGVDFSLEDKLEIAQKLDDIGVPQIEAGFPCISQDEKLTVKRVKELGLKADILALSRLKKSDIDSCLDCDVDLILLFVATSDLHLKHKYHCTREEIVKMMTFSLDYAKDHGIKASFSSEDATRTDFDFLKNLFEKAEKMGAERIGIADTTGCAHPLGIRWFVRELKKTIKKPISVHLHNDFGLALANALAAVEEGARAVGVTVNGLGERAGNVPLEQFSVAMKVFYNVDLGVDTSRLKETSDLVSGITGIPLPTLAPWVGDNVFTHESGIHAAAVLENPFTYESVPPEFVGNERRILVGKGSGRAVIKGKLRLLGIDVDSKEKLERIFRAAKESRSSIDDEELKRIAEDVLNS
jgi:methanogen homocitrate synthase